MTNALDGGYAEAAERKAAAKAAQGTAETPGRPSPPLLRSTPLVAVLVLAGLLLATAGVQARSRAPSAAAARTALIKQVNDRSTVLDEQQARLGALERTTMERRDSALKATSTGRVASRQLADLEQAVGATAASGPGVRVTLDDARVPADGSAPADGLGSIFDRDIQAVVNALWASGAEAIAVNGRRLTVQTAIRSAGSAILVDFRPLSPPYVIEAIGNTHTLETRFNDSTTGRLYRAWRSTYGIKFAVSSHKSLDLPASSRLSVRYAQPLDSP